MKSFFVIAGVIIVFFIIPYFNSQNEEKSIRENTSYTIGLIFKKTGSLKNGNHWHYRFMYNGKEYENYKSTHVDFDVSIGEYFLVELSSKKPEFNNILYGDKFKDGEKYYGQKWDSVPNFLLHMK